MSNLSVTTKIIQKLSDNSGSVIPIAAKDTLSNCAITYIYDKEASKQDGKEKAIEEFGTEVLWIGGIPLLKKLFDKTVYKFFEADPSLDIRKLKEGTQDSVEFAISKLKDGDAQKEILKKALDNKALYKRLSIAKFITSTAATLIGLSALITYKQKTTNKALEDDYKKKVQLKNAVNKDIENTPAFEVFSNKKDKDVNFKGSIGKALSGFMYSPVMNMSILDAGITTTRLAQGRKGEKFEIGFKEIFQILFIYCLAKPIQKGLEFASKKLLHRPIATQYQMLSNEKLSSLLKTDGLKESIADFLKKNSKDALDYVYDSDGALNKLLKLSGDVPVVKNTGKIDSLAYIDTEKIKNAAKDISDLLEGFENPKVKVDLDKYLSQVKKIKGGAVIANILIGAFAMGVLQPVLNIILRKKRNGDSENPAFKTIEQEMEQKFS